MYDEVQLWSVYYRHKPHGEAPGSWAGIDGPSACSHDQEILIAPLPLPHPAGADAKLQIPTRSPVPTILRSPRLRFVGT